MCWSSRPSLCKQASYGARAVAIVLWCYDHRSWVLDGMTTTPDSGNHDQDRERDDSAAAASGAEPPGAEIGISEGEGSSFEPEEDPDPDNPDG